MDVERQPKKAPSPRNEFFFELGVCTAANFSVLLLINGVLREIKKVDANLNVCWRVKKEFHCPLCLDKNPSLNNLLLDKVSRPSKCNHYGCTSCMKNWLSSTRYNGCPLCRKESKTVVNFRAEMYSFWLAPSLEIMYLFWIVLMSLKQISALIIEIESELSLEGVRPWEVYT